MAQDRTEADSETDDRASPARTISMFGREVRLPQSRALRIAIGILLILGGIVGFLPVLGFWMIPLGIFVLSYEIAHVRRFRRRVVVRFASRQKNGRRRA
ncbi:MAG: hypothetical protein WAT70_11135 [Rhizobiaceae bacterium]